MRSSKTASVRRTYPIGGYFVAFALLFAAAGGCGVWSAKGTSGEESPEDLLRDARDGQRAATRHRS
jgi:hypothetical protein